MFNNIDWKTELPDGRDPRTAAGRLGWQTKALGDLNMDRYVVTPDGKLYLREHDIVYTGNWYYYDERMRKVACEETTETDSEFSGPYADWEYTNERHTFVPFTGSFNFYGGDGDEWNEYVAEFEEGQLKNVYRDEDRDFRMAKNAS